MHKRFDGQSTILRGKQPESPGVKCANDNIGLNLPCRRGDTAHTTTANQKISDLGLLTDVNTQLPAALSQCWEYNALVHYTHPEDHKVQ